jgi:hypothetical protein
LDDGDIDPMIFKKKLKNLSGKTVIITGKDNIISIILNEYNFTLIGGNRNIGLAIAEECAKLKANIVIAATTV